MVISSGKYYSIKPHLSKQTTVSVGVSERVNLPSNPGSDPDLFQKELMTRHHIINHILIVRACLVVHGPSRVDELELTVLCEVAHLSLGIFVLLLPPHLEELHLNLGVLAVRVFNQLGDCGVQSHLHVGVLDVWAAPGEIPVHGFFPAEVVMGVRDQVNVELGTISRGRFVFTLEETCLFPMVGVVDVGLIPVFLLAGLGETQS